MDSNPYWALELEMTGRDSSSVASWHPNPCPGVFYSIQGWPMRCICTCSPSFMAGEMEDSTQQVIRQVSGTGTAVSSWTNPWARPHDGSSYTIPHHPRPESHPHPPLDEQRHPRPTAQHPTASTHSAQAPTISHDSSIYTPAQRPQPELSPEEFDLQLKQWFDNLNNQTTIYTPAPTTVNPTSTLLSKEPSRTTSALFPVIHHLPSEIEKPTTIASSAAHDTATQVEQTDDELARILQSKPTKLTHNSPGWLASPPRPEPSTKTPTARSAAAAAAASTVNDTSPLQHRSTFRGHSLQGGSIESLSYLKAQGQNAESSGSSSNRVDINRGKDFASQLVAGPSTRSRSMNESRSNTNAPSTTDAPSQSNAAPETAFSVQSGPSLAAWQTAYQTLASQGLLPDQDPLPSALAPPAHILSSNYPEFIIDPTNSAEPVQVKPPLSSSSGPTQSTQGRTAQEIYTSASAESTSRTTRPLLSLAPVNRRDREGLVVVELAQHFSPARLRPEESFYPTSAAGSGSNDAVQQGGWPVSDTGTLLPLDSSTAAGSGAPSGPQAAAAGLRGGHPMAMYQGFDPSDPWGIAAAQGSQTNNNATSTERSDAQAGDRGREEGPLDIAAMIFGATTTTAAPPPPPPRGST